MITDKQLEFASAQAVTAQAVSTNVVDLKKAGIDIGAGENVYVHVNCDVAMTDSGSDSTITAELVTDDNSGMSSAVVVQTLGVFPALSAVGAKVLARIQPSNLFERYIAIRFTPTGGNLTTGSFSAHILKDADVQKSYASGFTIA